jgi:hypothetical protein
MAARIARGSLSYAGRALVRRPATTTRRRLKPSIHGKETAMGHSSLVGTDKAPRRPKGTDEQALGPSDSTDSGSDTLGADTLPAADPGEPVDVTLNRDQAVAPIEGTGETSDEVEPSDIGLDRIIESPDSEEHVRAATDDGEDGKPTTERVPSTKPG